MKCENCVWGNKVAESKTELIDKTTIMCSRTSCPDMPVVDDEKLRQRKALIYVCSPLAGDEVKNLEKTARYCRFVASCKAIPFAPHLYFTSFLDESNSDERDQGMEMGCEVLGQCDAMWVFGNKKSLGMKIEIEKANQLGIPMRFFDSRCKPAFESHLIDPELDLVNDRPIEK